MTCKLEPAIAVAAQRDQFSTLGSPAEPRPANSSGSSTGFLKVLAFYAVLKVTLAGGVPVQHNEGRFQFWSKSLAPWVCEEALSEQCPILED